MAPKTWEQLSQSEKIDDLRRDVVRLFAEVSSVNSRMSFMGGHIGRIETMASKALKEVEALKEKLKKEADDE
jgi:hypothetical protein